MAPRGLEGVASFHQSLISSSSLPDITVADLAPTRCPHPRPWHRVPVPAASATFGLRVVWKRVGSVPRSSEDTRFLKAAAELRADSQGPRKTRRKADHVPLWGDAQWKDVVTGPETVPPMSTATSDCATVPDACLASAPRKRNSRRQVIVPCQPPPTVSAEPTMEPVQSPGSENPVCVDESTEHITKRAKRRISRRFSVLPTTQEAKSPLKQSARRVFSSPAARRMSQCVPDGEPETCFMPLTPGTIIARTAPFEPVLASPATALSTTPKELSLLVSRDKSRVVVFDQPVAKIQTESAADILRRTLLHNTRRREIRFSAIENMPPPLRSPSPLSRSSRRCSLFPPSSSLAVPAGSRTQATGRRHTFQPVSLATSPFSKTSTFQPTESPVPGGNNHSAGYTPPAVLESSPAAPTPNHDETVVVDVRTNPDIFGSGPPVQGLTKSVNLCEAFDLETQGDHTNSATDYNSTAHGTDARVSQPPVHDSRHEPRYAELHHAENANLAVPLCLGTLHEDATTEAPVEPAKQSLSPGLDASTAGRWEITDEHSLVSSQPASGELDQSLLFPLEETTETGAAEPNDAWQSPTLAELSHSRDLLSAPPHPELFGLSVTPSSHATASTAVDLPSGLPTKAVDMEDSRLLDQVADSKTLQDDADEEIMDDDIMEDADAEGHVSPSNAESMASRCDSPSPTPSTDGDHVDYTLTAPIHMLSETDEDATMTMTMDVVSLAEEQLSAHEDSETELLRRFVTRVKADKSAKAAAAAAAAAASARSRASLRQKRRSSSTGSTASSSGSPIAKRDAALASPFTSLESRVPLGKKDQNMSPSPKKRRKDVAGGLFDTDQRTRDLLGKPALDDISPPRPKRRRKKMEADTGGIFNPEFMAASHREEATASELSAGPRRSKRTRSNQTPLKSSAAAANTANNVLSLIPVRLPGSLNLNGEDNHALPSSLNLRRSDEKDLAMVTRVNTRKNKGKANHPSVVITMLMHQESCAKREQKSVFDSPVAVQDAMAEDRADATGLAGATNEARSSPRTAKTVRWAKTLARFQDSDSESSEKDGEPEAATNRPNTPENTEKAAVESVPVPKLALPERRQKQQLQHGGSVSRAEETPQSNSGSSVSAPAAPAISAPALQQAEPDQRAIPRRTTRVSRLQPPTPRKLIASAAAKASAFPVAASSATGGSTVKASTADSNPTAGTAGLKGPSAAGSAKRMATRRAKVVGLGMAGNGTPAPKRRTTRTT